MEAVKNLGRVLVKPSSVFEWAKDNPNFVMPVVLLIVVSIIFGAISAPLAADLAQKQMQNGTAKLTPAQEGQAKQMMKFLPIIAAVMGLFSVIFALFIQAALIHLGMSMFGGSAKFTVGIATVAYAQVPIVLQQIMQSIYVTVSGKVIAPGLSALLPFRQQMGPLGAFLGRIDIFALWSIILLVIGFSITYKVSKGKTMAVVVGYWLLGTILAVLPVLISGSLKMTL
ncbi:MAG: hypothetical protein COW32_06230 [Candidatus Aquicultor secundus]|uniref:Yip1 domain-containing protein n=1 Tax=Candidatus Aquicultor secundus TaxID=1973895 RepID=A0A2M7T7M6_9ACTN|nr:Yip1 family protein [Candidatus Aquicultor secundus]OIO87498.1 MAG: hypothetical protein AUK32_03805 [Candidatus Aquicultor secundus]PIU27749.1 MAG: hypothetical protein COT10_01880 [Candidatus Aquicultor secundus]PIW22135.1 MAG: hypothetical protein COW32_06230 [Candidatus Aquicultor secundus]PIX53075.1 MAG: hypothetical protein COZ51_00770 [Candidatus Aquicultor secundus]PIY38320.1 MAG: hypothetical protein COZ03_08465 [Candidatus Aquicultor secundus]